MGVAPAVQIGLRLAGQCVYNVRIGCDDIGGIELRVDDAVIAQRVSKEKRYVEGVLILEKSSE